MRELNVDIMGEDVDITTRVQRGVHAPSYHSGILNDEQESSVIRFQQRLRELLPRIAELEETGHGDAQCHIILTPGSSCPQRSRRSCRHCWPASQPPAAPRRRTSSATCAIGSRR